MESMGDGTESASSPPDLKYEKPSGRQMPRLAVIALDGFPYHLLRDMKDDLPNIGRVLSGGVWGRLESTVPYLTPTAWTTFSTGMNPGKHRVLGFFSRATGEPSSLGGVVNSSIVRGESLWRALSAGGVKVGVFGVPMTYKPETVNGYMISGFPIPKGSKDYTYPGQLRHELEGNGWDFADIPTQTYSKTELPQFYQELVDRVKLKTEAVLYMLDRHPVDFFMVHYFETDKILHDFLNFRYRERCSETDFAKFGNSVKDFMVTLDLQLGRVFDKLTPQCGIILVSDHGMAPGAHQFMIDTWLLKEGYLGVRRRASSRIRHMIFRLGMTPEAFMGILPSMVTGKLVKSFNEPFWEDRENASSSQGGLMKLLSAPFLSIIKDIDWEASRAYSFGGHGLMVGIYVKPELPAEEVSKLRETIHGQLSEITHRGKCVFDRVYYDYEVYKWEGDHHDIPDVIAYDEKAEYIGMTNPAIFPSKKLITKRYSKGYYASHDRGGIYAAMGTDFARIGEGIQLSIQDMHPTILHAFGLGVSRQVDGRVALELFKEGSVPAQREVELVDRIAGGTEASPFTPEEEEDLAHKLHEMGYI